MDHGSTSDTPAGSLFSVSYTVFYFCLSTLFSVKVNYFRHFRMLLHNCSGVYYDWVVVVGNSADYSLLLAEESESVEFLWRRYIYSILDKQDRVDIESGSGRIGVLVVSGSCDGEFIVRFLDI